MPTLRNSSMSLYLWGLRAETYLTKNPRVSNADLLKRLHKEAKRCGLVIIEEGTVTGEGLNRRIAGFKLQLEECLD